MKKLPLDELQKKARILTENELKNYITPDDFLKKIHLTIEIDGDERIFSLYIPGKRPKDAIVISRARMNIYTGEGFIEYIGLERKN